jgi:hypothetical protein
MDLEEYLLAAPAELRHDLRDLMADAICGATYQIERANPADARGIVHWTARYDRWNGLWVALDRAGGRDARTTQDQ